MRPLTSSPGLLVPFSTTIERLSQGLEHGLSDFLIAKGLAIGVANSGRSRKKSTLRENELP